MKKIVILLLMIFSIIILSGCYTKTEEQKFKEMLAIEVDSQYIIVGEDSATINNQVFEYKSIIEDKLKQDNKNIDDSFSFSSIEHTVYKNKIYLTALYNNTVDNEREYIIGYFDILTSKYNFIGYRETIDDELKTFIVGERFYILHKEYMEEYSVITDTQEVDSYFGNSKVFYNEYGIVFYDSNNTIIIDYHNKQNNLFITCNSVDDLYVNYIVYHDDKLQTVVYNYKTNETFTYKEYYELKRRNENYIKYNINIDDNNLSMMYSDKEINLSIEELRQNNEVIQKIESIFDTVINFKKVIFDNEEIYIVISNDDSFFGAYTKGSTYPAVFKLNIEDNTLTYIGCYAHILGVHNFGVYKK